MWPPPTSSSGPWGGGGPLPNPVCIRIKINRRAAGAGGPSHCAAKLARAVVTAACDDAASPLDEAGPPSRLAIGRGRSPFTQSHPASQAHTVRARFKGPHGEACGTFHRAFMQTLRSVVFTSLSHLTLNEAHYNMRVSFNREIMYNFVKITAHCCCTMTQKRCRIALVLYKNTIKNV